MATSNSLFSTPLPLPLSVTPPKPHAPPPSTLSFTTKATPEDSEQPTSDDSFDDRLSNIRLRYRSGQGKKADVRKSKKTNKKPGSTGSGGNIYLPPVPLKEPISGGLKVDFGFSPYSERINGRVAALGLAALVLVELATGESVIKFHSPSIVFVQVYFIAAVTAVYCKVEKEKASEWAPYISCLPRVEEMHSPTLWSDEELEMIKTSLLYDRALEHKAHIEKIYLSMKHVLDRFPEYFEDVTLDKFMHACNLVKSRAWKGIRGCSMIPFADFFNHDIDSETHVLDGDFEQFIAGKNYAPGDEVFIKYVDVDVTNDQYLLHFGFMIPSSQYDTVLVEITVPDQHDHLRAMKLDLLNRHLIPVRMNLKKSHSCGNYFEVKNVKSSCVEGCGISIKLRAFARVLCCTSPQELQQLAMEAAENDGHLARLPLKNKAREMEAHRFLHLQFDDMIQNHTAALESLTRAASLTLSGKCSLRMQLARDLLTNDLQVLRSASAWLKNYCETLKVISRT